jgi:CheY-like chemotaxis protein
MASHDERRLYVRARVPAAATAWIGGICKGSYLLDNLSLGGAYLTGGPAIRTGTQVKLHLELPGGTAVEVNGTVLRSDRQVRDFAVAVVFEALSEAARIAIGGAVTASLDAAARESLAHPSPAVLVVDHSLLVREKLIRDIRTAGVEAISFSTSVDAIEFLHRPDCRVRLALVDLAGVPSGKAVIEFLADQRPSTHRVLLSDAAEPAAPPGDAPVSAGDRADRAGAEAPVDAVLSKPWSSEALVQTLASVFGRAG